MAGVASSPTRVGANPNISKNANVSRQRNTTVAMSNSYKTPDFTIQMNGENQ